MSADEAVGCGGGVLTLVGIWYSGWIVLLLFYFVVFGGWLG